MLWHPLHCSNEAGVRSKIVVSSVDEKLDPVGARQGPKGSRTRTVFLSFVRAR